MRHTSESCSTTTRFHSEPLFWSFTAGRSNAKARARRSGSSAITIPDDITGATFSVDGFLLNINVDDNWYGLINFDLTASDGLDSSSTGFNVEVQSINDPPYFEPIGDGNIIMYEDIIYQELWLSIVSSGNEYEDDNLFFVLEFDDESLLFDDAPDSLKSVFPVDFFAFAVSSSRIRNSHFIDSAT